MTRKDYIAIAGCFSDEAARITPSDTVPYDSRGAELDALRSVANSLADVLRDDNPRFDRDRFLKACGVSR